MMVRRWSFLTAWVALVGVLLFLVLEVQANADKTREVVCGTLAAQIKVTLDANDAILSDQRQQELAAELARLWTGSGCVGEVPAWFNN